MPVHLCPLIDRKAVGTPRPKWRWATTDASGNFTLTGLEPGGWYLGAGPERAPWAGHVALVIEGSTLQVAPLVLPAMGSLEVRVVDSTETPVPRARVATDDGLELETDAAGLCSIPALPAGRRRVHADTEELGRGNTAFVLAEGEHARVKIVLRRPR